MTAVDPVIGRSRFKASGDQRHGNRSGNRILEHSRCVADPWQQKQQKGHLEIYFFFLSKEWLFTFFFVWSNKRKAAARHLLSIIFPMAWKRIANCVYSTCFVFTDLWTFLSLSHFSSIYRTFFIVTWNQRPKLGEMCTWFLDVLPARFQFNCVVLYTVW